MGIYFEIYNLEKDFSNKTKFTVTWEMSKSSTGEKASVVKKITGFINSLFAGKESTIRSTSTYSGETADEEIYLNLELANQAQGYYKLQILINDLVSNNQVTKEISFQIK
jgi:hypothetical protein